VRVALFLHLFDFLVKVRPHLMILFNVLVTDELISGLVLCHILLLPILLILLDLLHNDGQLTLLQRVLLHDLFSFYTELFLQGSHILLKVVLQCLKSALLYLKQPVHI
jgi:hypothetical protein